MCSKTIRYTLLQSWIVNNNNGVPHGYKANKPINPKGQ